MVSTLQQNPMFILDSFSVQQKPVEVASQYPQLRIMGSKHRLLPWLFNIFSSLKFDTVLDGFSGSGSVAYLFKVMGKTVTTNDYLQFPYHKSNGLIANSEQKLTEEDKTFLIQKNENADHFIHSMFKGIFYSDEDLHFLDNIWANLRSIKNP